MYEAKINKANHTITLGFQGENNARYADYDISEWVKLFGDGSASLVVIRPNETVPYIANTVQTGNTVKWIVSDVDVAIPGTGKAEFRYIKNGVIVKSETFRTKIIDSISQEEGPVTPPQQSIIDQMTSLKSEAEKAAQDAKNAYDRYPKIVNDRWYIWDVEKGEYVDSGVSAAGSNQSDWNQNDISKADYIKNRICYESDKKVESDILSEITAKFEPFDKYYVCTNDFLLPELAVGEPVVVYLDGVRYKTEIKTFNGMDYIGNFKIIADLNGIPNVPNTGEPFACSNDTGFFVTQGKLHTIRITKFVNEVVVLPSKFIPNEVIRATPQTLTPEQQEQARKNIGAQKSDIQADWNQNDASQPDYIKNRICYEEVHETDLSPMTLYAFEETQEVGKKYSTVTIWKFPKLDDIVNISWDGKEYTGLEVLQNPDKPYGCGMIGNASIAGKPDDTGEPFFLMQIEKNSPYWNCKTTASGNTHRIRIYKSETIIKKIDEKYYSSAGEKIEGGGEIFNDYANNQAKGVNSHAEGEGTVALGDAQHVQGRHNYLDEFNRHAFIIGNGTKHGSPSDAFTVSWDGRTWAQEDVLIGGNNVNSPSAFSVRELKRKVDGGGMNGATFTPQVSATSDGYELSWDNDKGLENPDLVKILNGKDGKTPQVGVDYFTESDKQQIVDSVIKELPNGDTRNY